MPRIRLAYKLIVAIAIGALALVFGPFGHSSGLTATGADASDFQGARAIVASASAKESHPTVRFAFSSSARTIPAAFAQADLPYRPEDHIQAIPDPSLGLGGVVVDVQAMPINLVDGTRHYQAYSWATSVGAFLKEQNITLGDDDKLSPSVGTALSSQLEINIVRVAVTQVTETGPIAYETVKQDDPTLNKGLTKVKTAGKNGVMSYSYRDTRENGVTISHVLISKTVVTAPESEILLVGTKPVITVRCAYNDTVIAAAVKYGVDANLLCRGIMIESNGHANSVGGGGTYYGLFQYTQSFWEQASAGAGYGGADWSNPTAQIYTTAWAISHGYSSRWPWT